MLLSTEDQRAEPKPHINGNAAPPGADPTSIWRGVAVGESLAVGARSDQEATSLDAGRLVFGFHFRAKALDATKSLLEWPSLRSKPLSSCLFFSHGGPPAEALAPILI